MMRRILVDHARGRGLPNAEAALVLSLDEGLIVSDQRNAEVVAIHEALEELARRAEE